MLVSAIFSLFYTFIFTVSINLSIKRKKNVDITEREKKPKKNYRIYRKKRQYIVKKSIIFLMIDDFLINV